MNDLVVRGYREGDEAAIRELFRLSFGHGLSPETWRWRYRDHPLGSHRITVAIASDGELLGHYGGYPVEWRHHATALRLHSHQNGDVMTAPRARRLGRGPQSVLGRMARHYWSAYGDGRVDFHYGVNAGTARDLQLQIVPNVRIVEPMLTWTAESPGARRPAVDSIVVDRITAFDADWDAFVDRVAHQYPLMSSREARVMNWRYCSQPGVDSTVLVARDDGRIIGASVFRVGGDATRWGDALFDLDHPSGPAAILASLRALDVPGRMHGWFSARPERWARTLEALGFRPAAEPRGLTLVYSPFTDAAEQLVPGLFYSWGDSDLF